MNIDKNICKLCQKDDQLIKAHIIPESLMKSSSGGVLYVFSNSDYRKKSQIGIYDGKILCKDCDNKIGVLDDKIKQFFDKIRNMEKNKENLIKINNDTLIRVDTISNDYFNIKLGLLSILYRAHITSKVEFNKVDLGIKYLGILHEYLIKFTNKSVSNNIEEFDVFISKYRENSFPKNVDCCFFDSPVKEKYDGINFYRFVFYGYQILFKVDSQNINNELNKYKFKIGTNYVLLRDISNRLDSMKKFIVNNPKKYNRQNNLL